MQVLKNLSLLISFIPLAVYVILLKRKVVKLRGLVALLDIGGFIILSMLFSLIAAFTFMQILKAQHPAWHDGLPAVGIMIFGSFLSVVGILVVSIFKLLKRSNVKNHA